MIHSSCVRVTSIQCYLPPLFVDFIFIFIFICFLFLFWSVSIIIGTERSWSLDFFHRKLRTHIFCWCALNCSLLHYSVLTARKRGPTLLLVTTQKCVWSFSPKHYACIRCSKSRLAGWVLLYVHRNRRLIRDRSPDGHIDLYTAPELWKVAVFSPDRLSHFCHNQSGWRLCSSVNIYDYLWGETSHDKPYIIVSLHEMRHAFQ